MGDWCPLGLADRMSKEIKALAPDATVEVRSVCACVSVCMRARVHACVSVRVRVWSCVRVCVRTRVRVGKELGGA